MSTRKADLSHRNPALFWTFLDGCPAKGHDEKDTLQYITSVEGLGKIQRES